MSQNQSAPGTCPECGRQIQSAYILITYEKGDGTAGAFAECPQCNEVVEPA